MLTQASELMGPHLTGLSRVLHHGDVVADDRTTR
jgi:hypothetical protein